jgi:ubiquinol-cytochrome c reductase cytochrome b subunit
MRFKGPIFKVMTALFALSFIMLAWLGLQPVDPFLTLLSQIFTAIYFAYFLLMPIYSSIDKTKPVPERVTS